MASLGCISDRAAFGKNILQAVKLSDMPDIWNEQNPIFYGGTVYAQKFMFAWNAGSTEVSGKWGTLFNRNILNYWDYRWAFIIWIRFSHLPPWPLSAPAIEKGASDMLWWTIFKREIIPEWFFPLTSQQKITPSSGHQPLPGTIWNIRAHSGGGSNFYSTH